MSVFTHYPANFTFWRFDSVATKNEQTGSIKYLLKTKRSGGSHARDDTVVALLISETQSEKRWGEGGIYSPPTLPSAYTQTLLMRLLARRRERALSVAVISTTTSASSGVRAAQKQEKEEGGGGGRTDAREG